MYKFRMLALVAVATRGNLAAEREARVQIAASEAQRQGTIVNTGK